MQSRAQLSSDMDPNIYILLLTTIYLGKCASPRNQMIEMEQQMRVFIVRSTTLTTRVATIYFNPFISGRLSVELKGDSKKKNSHNIKLIHGAGIA